MSHTPPSLRSLPSIDRLLRHHSAGALLALYSRAHVVRHCRALLDDIRAAIRGDHDPDSGAFDEESILAQLARRLEADRQAGFRTVVNATGTVLHTNLGRALLPEAALDALGRAAGHALNLEYDLTHGSRGRRESVVEPLLRELTGAEDATVVNNNAAAVLLCLNTLAMGKEVVVSRGELIEIGGAFRLPEIMAKSGAILREVGTTNRTHPSDYEGAIGAATGLLLKVHTSNYEIVGFRSEVGLAELVEIGRKHRIPVMEDLGSGALVDLRKYGLPKEPVVSERIAAGADVVTFSGDKLLGGPQAGLVVGAEKWVRQIARNPMHRALRCGKLTIVALEATLRLYEQAANLDDAIPTLRILARTIDEIAALGHEALPVLRTALGRAFRVSLEDSDSEIGSGALPTARLPTKVIAIEHETWTADEVARRFRHADPPIIGRVNAGRFLLDLRTILSPDHLIPRWSGGA